MLCEVCKEKEGFVDCYECGKHLCEDCVKIDLWGTGCGNIIPIYMCLSCFDAWLPPHIDAETYNPF